MHHRQRLARRKLERAGCPRYPQARRLCHEVPSFERNDAIGAGAQKEWNCKPAFSGANCLNEIEIEVAGLKLEIDLLPCAEDRFLPRSTAELRTRRSAGTQGAACSIASRARVRSALACARAGAREVVGVEAGAESIRAAEQNAARNQLAVRCARRGCFPVSARRGKGRGERFDLIILDPPSFTKTKSSLHDALRGYKELHVRAFKLLGPERIAARPFPARITSARRVFEKMIADALGRRAALGPALAALRTGARSSGACRRCRRRNTFAAYCSR